MEDRRREHRGGVSVANAFDQMIEGADTARGDHRHPDRVGDGARQAEVETGFGSVTVHRSQEYLAGAVIGEPTSPVDCVDAGRATSAMSEHFPPPVAGSPGIDCGDDAL